jgi:hypothetical protein
MCAWRIYTGEFYPKSEKRNPKQNTMQNTRPSWLVHSFLEGNEFPKAPLRRSTMCDDLGVINKGFTLRSRGSNSKKLRLPMVLVCRVRSNPPNLAESTADADDYDQ